MNRPEPDKAGAQRAGIHGRAMCSCKERALLVPYALTGCRPDEAVTFEAHVLECEACFEDLKLLDRAAALIGDRDVARLTLADLFYNAPPGDGPNGRLRVVFASIPQEDEGRESKQA